jgi:hypothetical protein
VIFLNKPVQQMVEWFMLSIFKSKNQFISGEKARHDHQPNQFGLHVGNECPLREIVFNACPSHPRQPHETGTKTRAPAHCVMQTGRGRMPIHVRRQTDTNVRHAHNAAGES